MATSHCLEIILRVPIRIINYTCVSLQDQVSQKHSNFLNSGNAQWQSIWIQIYVCLNLNILTFESSELEGRKIISKPFILQL